MTGGEIGPESDTEIMFSIIIMVMSSMLLANIFGQLTILTAEMNKSTIKFQEKLDTINTAMSNLGLPKWLKIEIKEYYINTSNRQD
jgi:hypothetical protein